MNMGKKVGFDLDGCLANFPKAYEQTIIDVCGGKDLFPKDVKYPPVWDWPQHYGYSDQEVKEAWDVIKQSKTFWRYLEPLEGLQWARSVNHNLHDVYYITDRVGILPKQQTQDWFSIQGIPRATVLITPRIAPNPIPYKDHVIKGLDLDCYIDDKWENCHAIWVMNPNCRVYCLTRPYNEFGQNIGIKRVYSIMEFVLREGLI